VTKRLSIKRFAIHDFGDLGTILVSRLSQVAISEMGLSNVLAPPFILRRCDLGYDHGPNIQALCLSDQWSRTLVIRRSRSFHDFACREFLCHIPLTPPMCKSAKCQSLAMCPLASMTRIVIAISHFVELEVSSPLFTRFMNLRNSSSATTCPSDRTVPLLSGLCKPASPCT
jgi:hypothetical protein